MPYEVLTDVAPRGGYKTSKALRESATAKDEKNDGEGQKNEEMDKKKEKAKKNLSI